MTARKRNPIVWAPAGDLKIHPTAQRRLVNAQLNKRMADLDLDAIGVLHGVRIDEVTTYEIDGGTHTLHPGVYIIDGQHRVLSLQRHGFGDWKVQVELHQDAVDPARASALFARLNATAVVSAYDRFIQNYYAGVPTQVAINEIVRKHGLRVARAGKDGDFLAVSSAERIYEKDSGATLDRALTIAVSAWGRTASAVDGKLLEGLSDVLFVHNGSIDDPVLIKKLAKYPGSAPGILGDAKGLKKIRKGSLAKSVAETIVENYNLGRRGDNRIALP